MKRAILRITPELLHELLNLPHEIRVVADDDESRTIALVIEGDVLPVPELEEPPCLDLPLPELGDVTVTVKARTYTFEAHGQVIGSREVSR